MRFKEFKTESIVQPVQPIYRPKPTDNPPKQTTYVPPEKKKPQDDKDTHLVDLIAEKKKRKKKKTKLARYFYPGFGYYGYGSSDSNAGDAGGMSGGDGGGGESVREGEVVSMQARKTPLVVAGEPYDWDIYDLRTNKMVANILGGDRHDKPLYEIRINSNGMTPSTRMLPTYVLKAGPNNNPPYRAYELEAPSEVDKIEKSPGPGGTTKLKPDTMDVFSHMAKQTAKGRYYGYNMILVEEGLDQYEIIEKALGAKIMEIDDAMELGYTDWNEDDGSGYPIIYLGNQINENIESTVSNAEEVKKFGQWACKLLKIQKLPKIQLSYNTKEAQQGHHTGRHTVGGDSIWVYANNRNLVDILRTVFHELVHWRQGELGKIKDGSSYPGSPIEAQADMLAGKYIKIYGKDNPNIFQ